MSNGKPLSYFRTHVLNASVDIYNIYSAMIGSVLAFLMELRPFLILLFFLIIVDLITGMYASAHKKEKISSRGIYRTIEKILVQSSVVLATEGIKLVLLHGFPLTFIVVFIIAVAEFKSIIENAETILHIEIWTFIKDKLKLK